jgi:hypothetical protein
VQPAAPAAIPSSAAGGPAPLPISGPRVDASFLSAGRFSALGLSAPTTRSMKEVFGFDSMTVVQHSTMPVILQGKDVLARAKTGNLY